MSSQIQFNDGQQQTLKSADNNQGRRSFVLSTNQESTVPTSEDQDSADDQISNLKRNEIRINNMLSISNPPSASSMSRGYSNQPAGQGTL